MLGLTQRVPLHRTQTLHARNQGRKLLLKGVAEELEHELSPRQRYSTGSFNEGTVSKMSPRPGRDTHRPPAV